MPLAQVWTDYPTNFSFQNHFFILLEFQWPIFFFKFNISHRLGLNFSKLNPKHWGFCNNTTAQPNYPIFLSFELNESSVKKTLFNIQYNTFSTLGQNNMKPTWCTPTHRGLSIREHGKRQHGLGDLNMTYKQNKQTTVHHR